MLVFCTLTLALITHVIRSGCHGNRQCCLVHSGGFAWTAPSVLCPVFELPEPERRERLHHFNCISFQSSEPETLNEASSYSAFLKETSRLLLLGAVWRCASPESEKRLTILLVFIVSRSTSIWYLLETFQSWLKQRFFCSLEPLALPALNPFKYERRAQPCLRNEIADSSGWLSRRRWLLRKVYSPLPHFKTSQTIILKGMLTVGRHSECYLSDCGSVALDLWWSSVITEDIFLQLSERCYKPVSHAELCPVNSVYGTLGYNVGNIREL